MEDRATEPTESVLGDESGQDSAEDSDLDSVDDPTSRWIYEMRAANVPVHEIGKSLGLIDYHYQPLSHRDSIRLLALRPSESSCIELSLREVQLQENPVYCAISYTWATEDGDASRCVPILCNGGVIWITKNCYLALHSFRPSNEPLMLWIWIDGVCINQDDKKERGHQVKLMGDVYRQAENVFVWLGAASTETVAGTGKPVTEVFFEYLSRKSELIESGQAADMDGSSIYTELFQEAQMFLEEGEDSPLLRGLMEIVDRRWWKRVWVVQEVSIPEGALVICGEAAVPHHTLFGLLLIIDGWKRNKTQHFLERGFQNIALHILAAFRAKVEGAFDTADRLHYDTLILLTLVRQLEATDARDYVFGLSGLHPNLADFLPPADYTQSPANVFRDMAVRWLQDAPDLDLLANAGCVAHEGFHFHERHTHTGLQLPSWVPDWSQPVVVATYAARFQSTRNTRPIVEFDDVILRVKGCVVDRVPPFSRASFSAYKAEATILEVIPGFQASFQLWSSAWKDRQVGLDPWDALLWTVDWKGNSPRERQAQPEQIAWIKQIYDILMSTRTVEDIEGEFQEIYSNALHHSSHYPLCVTAKGRLASVPPASNDGDIIALLRGGREPFVLRPVGDYYELVGYCYVYGIMDGEAFPEDPREQDELEWIEIH